MRKVLFLFVYCCFTLFAHAQINTDRVMSIGQNALYFEDYVLSIQYFNQVIKAKPYLAEPYFYRAVAKYYLDDFKGTEADASLCLERNKFLTRAYELRGAARQNMEDYPGALEDYNKGLEYNPENRQLLVNKAIVQIQKKDYNDAEQDINLLIKYHPKYAKAYLLRSTMHLEEKDTLAALSDIDASLSIDKYYAPAYDQRALLYYYTSDYKRSLKDLNEAIRLEPRNSLYYIRRGLVRYFLEDIKGALSDYDIVVSMDENNRVARFNRGLLRAQVGDDNNAIEDFDVVLQQEPDNFIALYNRGLLREQTGDYKGALEDINRVLEEYPNYTTGYFIRSDIRKKLRDFRGAEKDYWYASDLQQKANQGKLDATAITTNKPREESDKTIEKFNSLVVYDKDQETKSKYTSDLRGRVQDRRVSVDLEAPFVITYYERVDGIERSKYFDKSLDDLNKELQFRLKLILTNAESPLTDDQVSAHFHSIDEFSSKLGSNKEDVDAYFGRAMDFMVLQDLSAAIEDFTKVIELDPSFSLAYFNRAVVRYKQLEIVDHSDYDNSSSAGTPAINISMGKGTRKVTSPGLQVKDPEIQSPEKRRMYEYELIIRDYDQVIRLNPKFAFAYYNRANLRAAQKDYKSAILDYNEAIRVEPELAEAYFNRGLARLSTGDNERGLADLSKAGELGIVNAYAIIKRMISE